MIVDAKLERKHVKCVVVGDRRVGKTSLIFAALNKELPTDQQLVDPPTIHRKVIYVKNHRHEVEIFDTGDNEKHRFASYEAADVVVLCFSVCDYRIFRKSRDEWIREIGEYCPQKPFIVVGTKTDVREALRDSTDVDFVDDSKAELMAERLKANYYIGCAAKQMFNVDQVFDLAVTATKEIPRCIDKTDFKNAGQTVLGTLASSLPKPDLSYVKGAVTNYNPMEFSRRCAPVLKQTFINVRECWRNPMAFQTAKRKIALILPCLSTFIPVEEEEPPVVHRVNLETPPALQLSETVVSPKTLSHTDSGSTVSAEELEADARSISDRTNGSRRGNDTFEQTLNSEKKVVVEEAQADEEVLESKPKEDGDNSRRCTIQ